MMNYRFKNFFQLCLFKSFNRKVFIWIGIYIGMLKNLLREVITITAGKPSEPIADLLYNKSHVNEFIIAKKLDLTINQTRNILYKISNHGLVSSIRKKDKKKGWYTYFWKFEIIKCLEFLKNLIVEGIKELEEQSEDRKKNLFYVCKRCNIEMGEEEALLMEFTCNECGDVFTIKDNSKYVKELERNLEKLKEKLKIVNLEIEKEDVIIEKQKQKEFKKIQIEKDVKKASAALKRKKTVSKNKKIKEAKDASSKKKVVKKKSVKRKEVKKKVAKKKVVKKKETKNKVSKKSVKKKAVKKKK